ncbi:hypothetical protein FACS1894208_02200 [Clostridia bacterium]|nr:hypothetical protein FACS1894208_02200 [Clostridia bacterium]
MYLEGAYIYQTEPMKAVRVMFYGSKADREVILLNENGEVTSAFKQVGIRQFMALSDAAAKVTARVNKALSKIKKFGGDPVSFNDFPALEFYSKTRNAEITVISDRHMVFKVSVDMDIRLTIALDDDGHEKQFLPVQGIPYVELSGTAVKAGDEIVVRTVDEIRLTKKDLKWLDRVDYTVEQDEEKAEEFFTYLETYNGGIAYDTETTGLKINCFGKVNSKYARMLEEYNASSATSLNADRLCGVIFCVEPHKSYYFPCFSRKFKVLYDEDTPAKQRAVQNIRAAYSVGDMRDATGDMADFIRSGAELSPDVILMERVRKILEKGYIIAHNASFEWKVGMLYDIITNIRDDTYLLHQMLYRYGPNDHRKSDLKTLSWRELGIDQWGLGDFFPAYKEDEDARIRAESQIGKKKQGKGKKAHIDFSYMELDGTKIYAPADGDCTLQLWYKYKTDLKKNWKQVERLYLVEIAACPGIAYCEFYGHKLDVSAIEKTRQAYVEKAALLESKVRGAAELSGDKENRLRRMLELAGLDKADGLSEEDAAFREEALETGSAKLAANIKEIMRNDAFNIGSSKQLSALFYDKLEMPETSKGRSVAKEAIKALLEHKNPDGSFKYPIVKYFQEYKAADTLLSKFFDNLQDFMWPGGFIFSSYGQIAAATGRMSCKRPNAQQYPKPITRIIVPRENCVMMDADYSQIEYRVLVALAKEPKLLEAFFDPDNDYHTLMASIMYGVPYDAVAPEMRSDAKRFNFGIPYGMGIGSIAMGLYGENTPRTRELAKKKRELYFKDQPLVEQFFIRVKEAAVLYGYTETAFGRRRYYNFTSNTSGKAEAAKAAAQRQAGNAVVQGGAADIFKIAIGRVMRYIAENKLWGKVFLTNMVHDELLFEIDASVLDAAAITCELVARMSFSLEGYPPLYVGAGVSDAWAKAKSKDAEIHPVLMTQLQAECAGRDMHALRKTPQEWVVWFDERVTAFRRDKIIAYLQDTANFGRNVHPEIGNLIRLQFGKRISEAGINPKDPGADSERTLRCIEYISEIYDLGLDRVNYVLSAVVAVADEDEDIEYDDGEAGSDESLDLADSDFELLDDDKLSGVRLQDLIREFGYVIAPTLKVCGIDDEVLTPRMREDIYGYLLNTRQCQKEDEGALELVLHIGGGVLKYTGVYVNNLGAGAELEHKLTCC